MQEQPIDPINSDVAASSSFASIRLVGLGFLLFCSIVYLMASLRGLFPPTPSLALVGTLLILITLVSLRAVIQMRIAPQRASRAAALFLFLSFLAWEAPLDGGLVVIFSLLCLVLSAGLYLGCGLRELGDGKGGNCFIRSVVSVAVSLLCIAALFLVVREVVGWFLAMRLMLVVPAVVFVLELRNKSLAKAGDALLIRGHLKKEWSVMGAYGLLFAGVLLLFLNLVGHFILDLEGQHVAQALLPILLVASVFSLKPLGKRYRSYMRSIAAIFFLVVSAILVADTQPSLLVWVLVTLLTGVAMSAATLSLKAVFTVHEPLATMRLLYVAVIVALLVVATYPILHYLLGPQGSLALAPAALFLSLLVSFF